MIKEMLKKQWMIIDNEGYRYGDELMNEIEANSKLADLKEEFGEQKFNFLEIEAVRDED